MSIHGCSLAEYADMYSRVKLDDAKYLGFRDMPDLLRRHVNGRKALDYGCGPGKSSAFLRRLGFSVDGVDINEHLLEVARGALPDTHFGLLRDGRIAAADGGYDLVFCSWVLQDVGPRRQLVATVGEMARVLRPGGTLVALVPSAAMYGRDWTSANAEYAENEGLKSGDRAVFRFKENGFVMRPYFWTDDDYREALREAGLRAVATHSPLGRDGEGFDWVNEKEVAIFTVYVAKKGDEVAAVERFEKRETKKD